MGSITCFSDYLEIILPVCYGELGMTAQDIADFSPREIYRLVNGYQRRMKNRRLMLGSFVTVPVINSGVNAPKKGVTVKDILPYDVEEERNVTDFAYARHMEEVMEREEQKRKEGKNGD